MWDSPLHLLILLVVFCCLIGVPFLYFIPSIIAYQRHKANRGAIVAMNLLLGWTLIGWVIALIWALRVDLVDRSAH